MRQWIGIWVAALAWVAGVGAAAPAVVFDFTKLEEAKGWRVSPDVTGLEGTEQGMVVRNKGADPYIIGPARDYPENTPLWLRVRLRAEGPGMVQFFYFDKGATEEKSVRVGVKGGEWEEVKVPMPALGKGYRLRVDPPGFQAQMIVSRMTLEPRDVLVAPKWPKPEVPAIGDDALTIRAGSVTLSHSRTEWGGLMVSVDGKPMATGWNRAMIGYVQAGKQRWADVKTAGKVTVRKDGDVIDATAMVVDPDGGTWRLNQRFRPVPEKNAIDVAVSVGVDRERDATFVPLCVLLPGAGSFGGGKTAALFPGLEYLDKDEPSSSEADVIGAESKRQVPDSLKITFPMMTIVAEGRHLSLAWRPGREVCALFDSPDRQFHSGGHVMGLLYPGANGVDREEGSLMPLEAGKLAPNSSVLAGAVIAGGSGGSVVPAVQWYVKEAGLPELPKPGMDVTGFARLMAAGWLDSKVVEGPKFRHAWPGHFNPQPSSDAAILMEWLADKAGDEALAKRLRESAKAAVAEVKPVLYNVATVGHHRQPFPALYLGHVAEAAAQAKAQGTGALRQFEPDGMVRYKPGKVDYGKTHFAPDANGLTAQAVLTVLTAASVCGDPQLITEGLRLLRAMDKFVNTAPRGAQTWECPLHTPDILASAHLVRAYLLGYELTGDAKLLEMARHWAWTGVPFVYLVNPAGKDVGPYATIAVYGATNWVAPNWMGLPVQWCGLVYADALYRLAEYDGSGPWKQLADGIAISGIQQTWPVDGPRPDRQGLLPDSYSLRQGVRNDPAIVPATVQVPGMRYYTGRPVYSFRALRQAGLLVHAPGALMDLRDGTTAGFTVDGPAEREYWVLVAGCRQQPKVSVNGKVLEAVPYEKEGRLILKLRGRAAVEVSGAR